MNRLALLIAGLLATAASAPAFVSKLNDNGDVSHWDLVNPPARVHANVVNRNTRAIRYFLSSAGYSTANRDAELNAVRASFDQWQSVPGTIIKFEEAGLMTGAVDINTSDNTNVVFWTKGTTIVNGGRSDLGGATGICFTSFFSDNLFAEADIVFNGTYRWVTDYESEQAETDQNVMFVESVALHEIGHLLGLDHSPIGAATMFARGAPGVNAQAGLSMDEIAAAKTIYPGAGTLAALGRLNGTVTRAGAIVFGAAVFLEDASGNLLGGTITRKDGRFEMTALPPGQHVLRVSPFDPKTASQHLVVGSDIAIGFLDAETGFKPTNVTVTVSANATTSQDVQVPGGQPAFRVTSVRPRSTNPNSFTIAPSPALIYPGDTEVLVGVYSSSLVEGSTLSITGDGLTVGPTQFMGQVFGEENLLSVKVSVAPNATPGMRSFVVRFGNFVSYANGYIEVVPKSVDANFDSLDDLFQRKYFAKFTSPEAAPAADPDGDGFNNSAEFLSGTNPNDQSSVLRIDRVRQDSTGATVVWKSAAGRRYQLLGRAQVTGSAWQPVGGVITATGAETQFVDSIGGNTTRFYRLQAVP